MTPTRCTSVVEEALFGKVFDCLDISSDVRTGKVGIVGVSMIKVGECCESSGLNSITSSPTCAGGGPTVEKSVCQWCKYVSVRIYILGMYRVLCVESYNVIVCNTGHIVSYIIT